MEDPPKSPSPPTPQDWAWAIYGYLILIGFYGFIFLTFFYTPKLPLDLIGVIIGYIAGWISASVYARWERRNGGNKPPS